MSAVRVCEVSDVECSQGCSHGLCRKQCLSAMDAAKKRPGTWVSVANSVAAERLKKLSRPPASSESGELSEDELHALWMRISGGDLEGWDSAKEFARQIYAPAPRPDAPTSQIENLDKISARHCGHPEHPGCEDCNPGPAPREDGHGNN